jgi:hypothetical protein
VAEGFAELLVDNYVQMLLLQGTVSRSWICAMQIQNPRRTV